MKKAIPVNKSEATYGFAVKFIFRLIALTILFSIIPLLFVNLPLNMLLMNFGGLYMPAIILVNVLAVFLSCALAAKLIFSWGISGFHFKITSEAVE